MGPIEFELLSAEAPRTVASFVHLARSHHYDGLLIEKSHPGAYLVAGGHLMSGEPLYVLEAERTVRKSRRGSLWMAVGRDGARFTICRAPWPALDGVGSVFGELRSGDSLLDRLTRGDPIVRVEIVELEASSS
jgi:cyclophilin family peptidyl-prolyl cis-trans isomerase